MAEPPETTQPESAWIPPGLMLCPRFLEDAPAKSAWFGLYRTGCIFGVACHRPGVTRWPLHLGGSLGVLLATIVICIAGFMWTALSARGGWMFAVSLTVALGPILALVVLRVYKIFTNRPDLAIAVDERHDVLRLPLAGELEFPLTSVVGIPVLLGRVNFTCSSLEITQVVVLVRGEEGTRRYLVMATEGRWSERWIRAFQDFASRQQLAFACFRIRGWKTPGRYLARRGSIAAGGFVEPLGDLRGVQFRSFDASPELQNLPPVEPRCIDCGYSLAGLLKPDRCPECGADFFKHPSARTY